MLPIVILRPEPGASATARRAAALGLASSKIPLFRIEALPWTPPDAAMHDALLLTSANAVRHAGPGLAALTTLPAYAVGKATAAAAQAAGLSVAAIGNGGAQSIVDAMTSSGIARILWLTGAERSALDPGAAQLSVIACYAAHTVPSPPGWAAAIARPSVLLLHSVRAARRVATLAGPARKHLSLAAISPATAAAAGEGWAAAAAAPRPTDTDLLALAAELCQTRGGTQHQTDESFDG